MNAQAIKETKEINAQGAKEKKVNTVDLRSSAGQGVQEQRNVQVVHQISAKSNTSGGVLTGAAAAVATTLQSAKEAISKNE